MNVTRSHLFSIFEEFQKIPKGVLIDRPDEVIPTPFVLSINIIDTLHVEYSSACFTRRPIKHLAEKGSKGRLSIDLLETVLEYPDEIRKGKSSNRFVISKMFGEAKEPQAAVLEITAQAVIIVTSFTTDESYLSGFDLLWRTGIPPYGTVPPSAYSR